MRGRSMDGRRRYDPMPTISRSRTRALVSCLAAILALAGFTATPNTATARATVRPAHLAELTFSDDFAQPKGTPADSSKWLLQPGNGTDGWGNQQLQWYTRGARNAVQDGRGNMVITARKEQ